MTENNEPFLLKKRSEEDIVEYDKGFAAGSKGQPNDDTKTQAWQRRWAEAQR